MTQRRPLSADATAALLAGVGAAAFLLYAAPAMAAALRWLESWLA